MIAILSRLVDDDGPLVLELGAWSLAGDHQRRVQSYLQSRILFHLSPFLSRAAFLMLLPRVAATANGRFPSDSGRPYESAPFGTSTDYCLSRRKPTPAKPPKPTTPLLLSTSMIWQRGSLQLLPRAQTTQRYTPRNMIAVLRD